MVLGSCEARAPRTLYYTTYLVWLNNSSTEPWLSTVYWTGIVDWHIQDIFIMDLLIIVKIRQII